MIRRILNIPAFIIILSLIPGLAIWLLGKRRQATGIIVTFIFISAIFVIIPSMILWYLLCILYIGQMIYSAGLSIWQSPDNHPREIGPNSGLAISLPEKLSRVKQLDEAVFELFSRCIRPDKDLKIAILGLDTGSLKYKYIGVTENHLVLAECTTKGDPKDIARIQKPDVSWVNLQLGERNCLLRITFEEESHPVIILQIPGKFRKKAVEFVKEFPGTYGQDTTSFIEAFSKVHKMSWQPRIIAIGAIGLVFITFGMEPAKGDLTLSIIKIASFIFGSFLIGWPYVFWLIKQIKKEPGFISGNILLMFFTVPTIIYFWYISVRSLGLVIISILESIKQ